jgi:sugar lactone lactonase YvrE
MRMSHGVAILLAANLCPAQEYVISTFAGGAPLPTPASVADTLLPNTGALAGDASGNLYVDSDHSLLRISVAGVLTRVAGNGRVGFAGDGGPATLAQINQIAGIAIDADGSIYISDVVTSRVRKSSASDGGITTVAGTGTAGFSGDAGPATKAQLNGPTALALDRAGNLYIADTGNHRVRQRNLAGIISTAAGVGVPRYTGDNYLATYAALNAPDGLACDASGYLYIADSKNYVVRKIGFGGIITTVAGNGQQHSGGLDLKPNTLATSVPIGAVSAMATAQNGAIYVSDPDNDAIWQLNGSFITQAVKGATFGLAVDPSGTLYYEKSYLWRNAVTSPIFKLPLGGTESNLTLWYSWSPPHVVEGQSATAARLATVAIAFDPNGVLFLADNGLIRTIDADGMISTFDPLGVRGNSSTPYGETYPYGSGPLAFDSSGNLFVAGPEKIRKITPKGVISDFVPMTTVARVPGIGDVTYMGIDLLDDLYVSDGYTRIRRILPNGTSNVVAGIASTGMGKDNVGANTSAIYAPAQIAVDGYDSFYFADKGNNRVRRVHGGLVTTVAGTGIAGFNGDSGPAVKALLDSPTGVALDSSGNLFIADTGNNRIRKISASDGTITTIAGDGTAAYLGDGGPAIKAQLNAPTSLLFDKSGRLFVLNDGNHAIRVIYTSQPLALPATLLPGATTGQSYSFTLPARGGIMPFDWSVTAGALPAGLLLTAGGRIAGKPSASGTFDFTVSLHDAAANTVAQAYRIKVVDLLAVSLPDSLRAILGSSFSQDLTASGGTPPYVWSVIAGALPAGLLLSSSGTISGTPTATGVTGSTILVTDSANVMISRGLTISVVYPAPVITTATDLPAATSGVPYKQALSADIGNTPFAWSVASGSTLPPGLQLSADGILSGTPTASGTFSFTLSVTDSAGLVASQAFQILVSDSDPAPGV